MEHFKSQRTLRHRPEYRHLVRQYNDTGVMLMRYELGVQENWKNLKIQEIEAMISKPVFANDNAVVVSGGGEKKSRILLNVFPQFWVGILFCVKI